MIDSSALVVFWKGARFVHPKSLSFRQSSCKVTKGQSQAAQPGAARTSEGRQLGGAGNAHPAKTQRGRSGAHCIPSILEDLRGS